MLSVIGEYVWYWGCSCVLIVINYGGWLEDSQKYYEIGYIMTIKKMDKHNHLHLYLKKTDEEMEDENYALALLLSAMELSSRSLSTYVTWLVRAAHVITMTRDSLCPGVHFRHVTM